jgi:hypothetical protein
MVLLAALPLAIYNLYAHPPSLISGIAVSSTATLDTLSICIVGSCDVSPPGFISTLLVGSSGSGTTGTESVLVSIAGSSGPDVVD